MRVSDVLDELQNNYAKYVSSIQVGEGDNFHHFDRSAVGENISNIASGPQPTVWTPNSVAVNADHVTGVTGLFFSGSKGNGELAAVSPKFNGVAQTPVAIVENHQGTSAAAYDNAITYCWSPGLKPSQITSMEFTAPAQQSDFIGTLLAFLPGRWIPGTHTIPTWTANVATIAMPANAILIYDSTYTPDNTSTVITALGGGASFIARSRGNWYGGPEFGIIRGPATAGDITLTRVSTNPTPGYSILTYEQ